MKRWRARPALRPAATSALTDRTIPDTCTTSPGTHESTRSSVSSTSTERGTRPASRTSVSASWIFTRCQSTVTAESRMGSNFMDRHPRVAEHRAGGSNLPCSKRQVTDSRHLQHWNDMATTSGRTGPERTTLPRTAMKVSARAKRRGRRLGEPGGDNQQAAGQRAWRPSPPHRSSPP